jgi:hypothetical protein
VGARSRAKVNRPAPHDCAVGGVLDADHVGPGDDSIDVVDVVGENRVDVGALLMWAASLAARAAYHADRNGICSVGMLDTVGAATGDTTKCPVRPTGRQERQA